MLCLIAGVRRRGRTAEARRKGEAMPHNGGRDMKRNFVSYLALAQGAFYIVTGVWPLVSIGSFQKVTGPKTDLWLVKTAGVLITAIGGMLMMAGLRRTVQPEVPVLGAGAAAGLTAIDVIYVAKGRIAWVYLLDALVEVVLIAAWLWAWQGREQGE